MMDRENSIRITTSQDLKPTVEGWNVMGYYKLMRTSLGKLFLTISIVRSHDTGTDYFYYLNEKSRKYQIEEGRELYAL